MYLGQNTLWSADNRADGQLIDSAMALVRPEDRVENLENPCPPPFDCSGCPVKVVEKKVTVPGPVTTQIVYRDRYITQPGAVGPGVVVRIPAAAAPEPGIIDPGSVPDYPSDNGTSLVPDGVLPSAGAENSEMSEGAVQEAGKKKFPWWLLAAGGAAVWYFSRKK